MKSSLIHALGFIVMFTGIAIIIPSIVSYIYHESLTQMFVFSGIAIVLVGLFLILIFRKNENMRFKTMILIILLGWVITILLGAVPYLLSGAIKNPVDALFESASGFTTTGASILPKVENLPFSILFWRSFTHWLGGMGIILMIIAILPSFGIQGTQLFQAEVSGGSINKRISPRIRKTAMILWLAYISITALGIILLLFGGLNFYESVIHTFGAVSTGGFSSKDSSIGYYASPYVHYVIILIMFLSAVNFILYCRFFLGERSALFKNKEFRLYFGILIIFTLIITFNIYGKVYPSLGESFRYALFQETSIISTTGYTTADFDTWPSLSRMLLFVTMFIGGCVGSTAGSIKVLRIYVLFKSASIELLRVIHPNIVKGISMDTEGRERLAHETTRKMIRFFFAYIMIFAAGSIFLASLNIDIVTSMSATATTMAGIGPGLGNAGASESYADFPIAAKIALSLFMLIGRLEIFSFIIIFMPFFWKD